MPDDSTNNPPMDVAICAQTIEGQRTCKWLLLSDDEVNLTQLEIQTEGFVTRSGHPYGIHLVATNPDHLPQYTNLVVHLSMNAPKQLASLDSVFQTLQLTNGEWSGPIVIRGKAERVSLVVEGAGFRAESSPFDLIDNLELTVNAADFGVHPVTQNLLLLEKPAREGDAGSLVEIDPLSGLRLRTFKLSQPADHVAVSPNGSSAWLHSTASTLQRIDLVRWALDREVLLEGGATPRTLIVLPGMPERVVVSQIRPGGPLQPSQSELYVIENGQLSGLRHPANAYALLAGGPDLFFATIEQGGVQRYRILPDKMVVEASQPNTALTLSTDEKFLYAGYQILDLTNLTVLKVIEASPPYVHFPEHQAFASVVGQGNSALAIYNTSDWEGRGAAYFAIGSMGSPLPNRLQRWGDSGLALLSENGQRLVIGTSPFIAPPPVDLQLTVKAPALVTPTLERNSPLPTSVDGCLASQMPATVASLPSV